MTNLIYLQKIKEKAKSKHKNFTKKFGYTDCGQTYAFRYE